MDGVPDEEGWVTVTKTGKYKGVARTEAVEERTKAKEKKKRKNKVNSRIKYFIRLRKNFGNTLISPNSDV